MFAVDPYIVRPKRDWAIVRQDQRKTVLASGLVLPTETHAEKLHEGSGIIIRLGQGPKVKGCNIKEGDRVMYRTYLRHAVPIEAGAKWLDGSPQEFFFIDVSDLTAVIDPDLEVGPLSGSLK